jgi:radical SAM superfamily enzyme YgiQ (UPF0313 family)
VEKMKILLIEPTKPAAAIGGDDVFIYEPLALEYLAGGISDRHEVRILDLRLEKGLKRTLTEFQPDIVGITAYTIHVNVVLELFKKVKTWNRQVLTVVGGHHATVMPGDFISPHIDLIVIGEGVDPFRAIVERLERKENYDGIPGAAPATAEGIVGMVRPSNSDLDALPFPDRNLTKKYRQAYFSEWMKPLATIRTSKGCPYRCKFCALWKITEGKYFKRDPRAIVEELSQIEEDFIFFADDESLIDAPRMAQLADLIKGAGIHKRYFLYARSDTITKYPDLLKKWCKIGLERVFVGIEFCQDEDLDFINKKSTIADNDLAIKILHELDIDVYASFIIRPEFGSDDFSIIKDYCRQSELIFASFAVLTPLPGTDLYQEVKDQMILHDYDFFDFIHTLLPTKLPMKQFYREYHDLYSKGIPFNKQLEFLRKFPGREIPKLLLDGRKFYNQLKSAYKDYQ